MILGTLPALLTFFIRTFVPESEKWEKEHATGSTSNWAGTDLFAVLLGLGGPLLIIAVWSDDGSSYLPEAGRANWLWIVRALSTLFGLALAVVCYSYPVLRYCQRVEASTGVTGLSKRTFRRMMLAACLSGVALLGTWGSTQNIANWADEMSKNAKKIEVEQLIHDGKPAAAEALQKKNLGAREYALIAISAGAIVGTLLAAWMGDFLGRRITYAALCFLSMLSVFYLFALHKQYDNSMLFSAFITGACTAAFYGWLPLYLPVLFNTNVRATGQGFGFNFGRVLAAIGTLQIVNLLSSLKETFQNGMNLGSLHIEPGWPVVCSLLSLIYLVGMVIIWFAPETKGEALPE